MIRLAATLALLPASLSNNTKDCCGSDNEIKAAADKRRVREETRSESVTHARDFGRWPELLHMLSRRWQNDFCKDIRFKLRRAFLAETEINF